MTPEEPSRSRIASLPFVYPSFLVTVLPMALPRSFFIRSASLFAVATAIVLGAACGGGGDASDAAASGATGGSVPCMADTDCMTPDTCSAPSCVHGVCIVSPLPEGTPASTQIVGDCKRKQCDKLGNTVDVEDPSDVMKDGNECTDDVCMKGMPMNPPSKAGAACGMNGMLACDGKGKCLECSKGGDCGADEECKHPMCNNGVCGVSNEAQGKPLAAQKDGDCKIAQCDGSGGTEQGIDDSDVPKDATVCTKDICTQGAPSNPAEPALTPCAEGSGTLCDGSGNCVECIMASDCPGIDDECQQRVCNAGVCGLKFSPFGTVLASQIKGDCQSKVCDGAGGTTTTADNNDIPNDNNACTVDACMGGQPVFPKAPIGTPCGAGLTCDASGNCAGCTQPSQCPGVDDECKTRTCKIAVCGQSFTQAGTPVASQVSGDCKQNVCDGSGNIIAQNDDLDVPADDGNQCTGETCSAGLAGHPAKPTNTPCNQNGGSVCSAGAACVECNAPSQCAGSDTDCHARTCNANTCGVSNTQAGTPTSSQTPGDCKEDQCDGNGGVMSVTKASDVPLDDGNPCTGETCNGNMPQHPASPLDTPCNQGGGLFCDGKGTCVQCNSNAECASMVCDPMAHTCTPPSCNDNVKNGSETDVDCGGPCPNKCGPGLGCAQHSDCAGGACNPGSHTCAPTCTDPSAQNATCASYCSCMTSTCPAIFADYSACIASCSGFVEPQLCCRAYHCGAAMSDPVTHCPHAAGQAVCP